MTKDRGFDPKRLDVMAFAVAGAALSQSAPQAQFNRLSTGLLALPGDRLEPPVQWSAFGETRQVTGGSLAHWIRLQANVEVTLQCQRCLQAMQQPIAVDRWFQFVGNEDDAARLDEESEEDVLAASARFDLLELLEDELILALPIVPRHEDCPQPLPWSAEQPTSEAEVAPNPFAALAALRRPPTGN
jgi:uncharacterized protein